MMVINLVKKNVAEKQRGGEALAISVPSHDFSHDFWSVLMQVFFLADTLTTLPSLHGPPAGQCEHDTQHPLGQPMQIKVTG